MAKYPVMPVHIDAYLSATEHLSTIEHGAYQLILFQMWRHGGALLNNDRVLARCAGLDMGRWKRMKPTIMAFMQIEGNYITQRRLIEILDKLSRHSKSQSDRAKSKWLKINGPKHAAGMPPAIPTHMPKSAKVKKEGESSLEGSALSPPKSGHAEEAIAPSGPVGHSSTKGAVIEVSSALLKTRLVAK